MASRMQTGRTGPALKHVRSQAAGFIILLMLLAVVVLVSDPFGEAYLEMGNFTPSQRSLIIKRLKEKGTPFKFKGSSLVVRKGFEKQAARSLKQILNPGIRMQHSGVASGGAQ